MGRLKRKASDKGLRRIYNVDTVSEKELVEVAQKLRDAKPHTKVYIMTEDELKKAAHQSMDQALEKTAHDYREITGTWMLCAFCLYLHRFEKKGAQAIVNRLEKITEIASYVDKNYEFVQDLVKDVFEETGVNLI